MNIIKHIPVGHDNAITRQELMYRTGVSDRGVRALIEQARKKTPIINAGIGNGYFIPDMKNPVDRALLRSYLHQEKARARSIRESCESIEDWMLENAVGDE